MECALKACIAKEVREFDFPSLRRVRNSYNHDFKILLETAGLDSEFRREISFSPAFSENWNIVAGSSGWKACSRYDPSISEGDARALLAAVTHENAGILTWIKRRW